MIAEPRTQQLNTPPRSSHGGSNEVILSIVQYNRLGITMALPEYHMTIVWISARTILL